MATAGVPNSSDATELNYMDGGRQAQEIVRDTVSLNRAGGTEKDGKFYDKDNPDQPLTNGEGQPMNKQEAVEYANKKLAGEYGDQTSAGQGPSTPDGSNAPAPATGSPGTPPQP